VAQVVEHLPSKCEAEFKPQYQKKARKKKEYGEKKNNSKYHVTIFDSRGMNRLWSLFIIKMCQSYCPLSYKRDYISGAKSHCFCCVYHIDRLGRQCNFPSQLRQEENLSLWLHKLMPQ
jgi:hypothetical protein